MYTIYHKLHIGADNKSVYHSNTTHEGLSKWWIPDCTVKPEIGFINKFRVKNEVHTAMEITGSNGDCQEGTPKELA